jgi:hypothetical protein
MMMAVVVTAAVIGKVNVMVTAMVSDKTPMTVMTASGTMAEVMTLAALTVNGNSDSSNFVDGESNSSDGDSNSNSSKGGDSVSNGSGDGVNNGSGGGDEDNGGKSDGGGIDKNKLTGEEEVMRAMAMAKATEMLFFMMKTVHLISLTLSCWAKKNTSLAGLLSPT